MRAFFLFLTASVTISGTSAFAFEMTDQAIADHVEDELEFDPAINEWKIDVAVADGIAELNGRVDNALARDRAARVAMTVRGVRSVINQIQVSPVKGLKNGELEDQIHEALLFDPATELFEVTATAANGVVTLNGEVGSYQERDLVERVVKGVRGVVEVENNLAVDFAGERTDAEIRQEVRAALDWSTLIDYPSAITVSVEEGVVSLSGFIGAEAHRLVARDLAFVRGVNEVQTKELNVVDWADADITRNDSRPTVDDTSIGTAIAAALLYDPRVNEYDVKIDVAYGMVTLRGTVNNRAAKQAAQQVAENTYGVIAVNNRIKLRQTENGFLNDDVIQKRIEAALKRDSWVDEFEIDVEVDDGVVYLRGSVDTSYERRWAESIASRVRDTIYVNNMLTVDGFATLRIEDPALLDYEPLTGTMNTVPAESVVTKSDAKIRKSIEDELWWSPFVDSDQVNVAVSGGKATLTGNVDSIFESRAAAENAIEGGAQSVQNELTVRY